MDKAARAYKVGGVDGGRLWKQIPRVEWFLETLDVLSS